MQKEIPLGSESIEEQYKKGPGTAPDITQAQIPQTKEERVEMIKGQMDDLRLLVEYDRLNVEAEELMLRQMETRVMLGMLDINTIHDCPFKSEMQVKLNEIGVMSGKRALQNEKGEVTVPGLQGLELTMRFTNTRAWLADVKRGIEDAQNAQKEAQEEIKAQEEKANV